MKADFTEYESYHCRYCSNKSDEKCIRCTSTIDYIGIPSQFVTQNGLARQYFEILSEYSRLLYCIGFEVEK